MDALYVVIKGVVKELGDVATWWRCTAPMTVLRHERCLKMSVRTALYVPSSALSMPRLSP